MPVPVEEPVPRPHPLELEAVRTSRADRLARAAMRTCHVVVTPHTRRADLLAPAAIGTRRCHARRAFPSTRQGPASQDLSGARERTVRRTLEQCPTPDHGAPATELRRSHRGSLAVAVPGPCSAARQALQGSPKRSEPLEAPTDRQVPWALQSEAEAVGAVAAVAVLAAWDRAPIGCCSQR